MNLSDIPFEDWEEAKRREIHIRALAERKPSRLEVAHAAGQLGLSITWTYELLKRWKKDPRTSSLVPHKTGRIQGTPNVHPDTDKIIVAAIEGYYASAQKPSKTALWRKIADRCREKNVPIPSRETIRRRLRVSDQHRMSKKRDGAAKAHSKFGAVYGSLVASEPMELIQIDHTLVDTIIVDEVYRRPIGRPWLTLAMDVRTRMVVGFLLSLEAPSSLSVALTVSQTIMGKGEFLGALNIETEWPCEGVPTRIHLDNAKEFRAEALQRGCEEHGIILEYRPVAKPWYGGHVERLLGTLMKEAHLLPGSTFSNTQEKGNYDSEKMSAMTFKELERWLSHQILGVYHNSLHRGLEVSPISKWRDDLESGWRPRTLSRTESLLLDFLPFEQRMPRRDGIRLFNISYWNDLLPTWAMQKPGRLPVKYDPRDLSTVWLQLPDGEYAALRYKDPNRPPITLWEQRAAVARARDLGRQTVDETAIFQFVEANQQIVSEAVKASKVARRNAQRKTNAKEKKKIVPDQNTETSNDNEEALNYGGRRNAFEVEFW